MSLRRTLILGLAWTGVMLVALVWWPWSLPDGGCWRLVQPPPGCSAELARLNDRIWWTQTLPLLAFFASGYIVLGLLAIRHRRRSRH